MMPQNRQKMFMQVLLVSLRRIVLSSLLHLVLHKTAKLNRVKIKTTALVKTKLKPSALRQEKGTEQRKSTRMKWVAAKEAAMVHHL